MLQTVRAIFKDGQIQLLEKIDLPEGTEMLVTPLLEDSDFWLKASHSTLEKVWDNIEDDVYGKLLTFTRLNYSSLDTPSSRSR